MAMSELLSGINHPDASVAMEAYDALKLASTLVKEYSDPGKYVDAYAAIRSKLLLLQGIGNYKRKQAENELQKIVKQLHGISHAIDLLDSYVGDTRPPIGEPAISPPAPEPVDFPLQRPVVGEGGEGQFPGRPTPIANKLPNMEKPHIIIFRPIERPKPAIQDKLPIPSPEDDTQTKPAPEQQIPETKPTEEGEIKPTKGQKIIKKICYSFKPIIPPVSDETPIERPAPGGEATSQPQHNGVKIILKAPQAKKKKRIISKKIESNPGIVRNLIENFFDKQMVPTK